MINFFFRLFKFIFSFYGVISSLLGSCPAVFHNERNPSLNTVILYRRKHVKGYSIELIKDDILQSCPMIKVNLDLVCRELTSPTSQRYIRNDDTIEKLL